MPPRRVGACPQGREGGHDGKESIEDQLQDNAQKAPDKPDTGRIIHAYPQDNPDVGTTPYPEDNPDVGY